MSLVYNYLIYVFLMVCAVLSVTSHKLTITAGIGGFIVSIIIYKGAGYTGVAMLAAFFIAGSVATGWRSAKKRQIGVNELNNGRRTTGQVIANGGVAAISGAIAWARPEYAGILQLMMAGSLATATADTLSSELGTAYGRRFYDIITFKQAQPGPDGVVSLEGTLIGIAGATLIAMVYSLGFGFNYFFWLIIAAGTIGNLMDSILGATFERRHFMRNNTVNFLNTLTGAIICLLEYLFIK